MAQYLLIVSTPEILHWDFNRDWISQLNKLIEEADKKVIARKYSAACLVSRRWDNSWGIVVCPRCPCDETGFDSDSLSFGSLSFFGDGSQNLPNSIVFVEDKERIELEELFKKTGGDVNNIHVDLAHF